MSLMSCHRRSGSRWGHPRRSIPLCLTGWALGWVLMLIGGLGHAFPVWAVSTQQVVHNTPEAFGAGTLESIAVGQEGVLSMAPALSKRVDVPDPVVWRVGQDSKGNLYLATGNDGRVYIVRPGAKKPEVLADFAETLVMGLAVRPDGMVFAATSPDGKVYRVADGTPPQPLANPSPRYLWDMILDSKGNLLVATGAPGSVIRINESGTIDTVLSTTETHLLSLATGITTESRGLLFVGSAENGYVYQVDLNRPSAPPEVLLDAPGNEVKQVLPMPDGAVVALTLGTGGEGSDNPLSGLIAKAAASDQPPPESLQTRVYRLVSQRAPELLWQSIGISGHSLGLWNGSPDNPTPGVLLGIGEEGKIALISGPDKAALIADASGEQVTQLLTLPAPQSDPGVWAVVSNPGALYRLSLSSAGEGIYQSPVIDSKGFAEWGSMDVRLEQPMQGSISVQTRSGNTGSVDDTWAAWQDLKADSRPDNAPVGGRITSAPARYLQYRLMLRAKEQKSPRVREVGVFFLPLNQPPVFTELVVLDPDLRLEKKEQFSSDPEPRGINRPKVPSTPPGLKEKEEPGTQALRWTATDPDEDSLRYSVSLRRTGETVWKPLKGDLEENFVNFPARTLPDGWYQAKVVASDVAANRVEAVRETEKISAPFPIDHAAPLLASASAKVVGRSAQVRLDVQELTTRVTDARYSLDGGTFVRMFPDDKVLDEAEERFSFSLGELSVGEHVLVLEVVDFVGNVATGKLAISIK